MDASVLCHTYFKSPKVFNSINVIEAFCKFIVTLIDSIIFFISVINKPFIGFKTIGIEHGIQVCFLFYNWHEFSHRVVFDDLDINFVSSFQHTGHMCFSTSSAPSDSSNSKCSKTTFIKLKFTIDKWIFRLTNFNNSLSKQRIKFVGCLKRNMCQFCRYFSFDIEAEITNNFSCFTFANVHSQNILVFLLS